MEDAQGRLTGSVARETMQRLLTSVPGNSQKLDGGAMFGNAPKAMWSKWMRADEQNRIDLACRTLLVREPSRNILFEAGIGAFFEPRLAQRYGVQERRHVLLDNLREAGLRPEDIDVVVLSHLHFDHAGGLLSPWREGHEPELVFPAATFVVGNTAWERAQRPHPRDRASFVPVLQELLDASGRLELVGDRRSETLGDDYTFHVSHGHTPGMLLAEIPGEHGPTVFASDLVPGQPWVRKAITMGYDRYPELLIEEKDRLLRDLAGRGGRLFFTHDPVCAVCSLRKNADKGFVEAVDPLPRLRSTPA